MHKVWIAPSTTDHDRKELLRTLMELDLSLPRMKPSCLQTDEDTISLLRRLAAHYPDDVIAGILNRQGGKTVSGERFTANQVCGLRRYRDIPRHEALAEPTRREGRRLAIHAEFRGDPQFGRSRRLTMRRH